MQTSGRNLEIDSLRGTSIFTMILIHTNAYFLHIPVAFALWDISEFAVPAFIFCSAYVFFLKFESLGKNPDIYYVWKRIKRLLILYYLFLLINIVFVYVGQPKRINTLFILKNLFIIGGFDFNWLVLLFVELVPVMIFLFYVGKKSPLIFYLYSFISCVSLFFLLFFHSPVNYRYIMWIPWSTVVVAAWFFIRNEKKPWFFPLTLVSSLAVFLFSRAFLLSQHQSITQFNNKYPPNLYHISYGVFCVVILYFLLRYPLFKSEIFMKPIHFLSRYSYEVFFVHILMIYIFRTFFKTIPFTWATFFVVVLSLTICIQLAINTIKKMFQLID